LRCFAPLLRSAKETAAKAWEAGLKIAVGSVTLPGGIESVSVGFPPPNGVRGRFPAWEGV